MKKDDQITYQRSVIVNELHEELKTNPDLLLTTKFNGDQVKKINKNQTNNSH